MNDKLSLNCSGIERRGGGNSRRRWGGRGGDCGKGGGIYLCGQKGGRGRSARVITGEADAAATEQAVTFCLYARKRER